MERRDSEEISGDMDLREQRGFSVENSVVRAAKGVTELAQHAVLAGGMLGII